MDAEEHLLLETCQTDYYYEMLFFITSLLKMIYKLLITHDDDDALKFVIIQLSKLWKAV